jgi:RNA polymerase sigma factor (sigma-70 family)
MTESCYLRIKRLIKHNIQPINGYLIEDLIHDTILKLLETNGKTEADYCNLCVKVARNIMIDNYRKDERFKNIYDKEPEKECYQKEKKPELNVPKKYKALYLLRYKFEFRYSEIAKFYGIPLGTVKGRIYKMKNELKELNK